LFAFIIVCHIIYERSLATLALLDQAFQISSGSTARALLHTHTASRASAHAAACSLTFDMRVSLFTKALSLEINLFLEHAASFSRLYTHCLQHIMLQHARTPAAHCACLATPTTARAPPTCLRCLRFCMACCTPGARAAQHMPTSCLHALRTTLQLPTACLGILPHLTSCCNICLILSASCAPLMPLCTYRYLLYFSEGGGCPTPHTLFSYWTPEGRERLDICPLPHRVGLCLPKPCWHAAPYRHPTPAHAHTPTPPTPTATTPTTSAAPTPTRWPSPGWLTSLGRQAGRRTGSWLQWVAGQAGTRGAVAQVKQYAAGMRTTLSSAFISTRLSRIHCCYWRTARSSRHHAMRQRYLRARLPVAACRHNARYIAHDCVNAGVCAGTARRHLVHRTHGCETAVAAPDAVCHSRVVAAPYHQHGRRALSRHWQPGRPTTSRHLHLASSWITHCRLATYLAPLYGYGDPHPNMATGTAVATDI